MADIGDNLASNVAAIDHATGITPAEATLIMRLHVFYRMRWIAIFGFIVATFIAIYPLHIKFPVVPVFIICAAIAGYNLIFIYQARNLEDLPTGKVVPKIRALNYQHSTFDFLALAALLHFTGGVENPFIFLFIAYIVSTSVPLPYRTVYFYSAFVISAVTLLVLLEFYGIIPHVNLEGFALPDLYKNTGYVVGVLTALGVITLSTAYVITTVTGELRKRQRQVAVLREELLEERTRQLEHASNEISRLDEEKNRFLNFLSIAAHDLKAPLTAIQGFLWLLLKGFTGPINDKQKNILERSTIRIAELLVLISDLLDIPRIEKGQIIPEMKEISLGEVVKQATDELRDQASGKGLNLKLDMAECRSIYGSPARLKQVVTNLVHNAINYTDSGSVNVTLKEKENNIVFEVADTGIGIPPDELPKIFEDFFRASNATVKGTGLGLSISRRIVEAHGGKICVESPCENGTGSRFSFSIPVVNRQ